jgi:hypothetical protein
VTLILSLMLDDSLFLLPLVLDEHNVVRRLARGHHHPLDRHLGLSTISKVHFLEANLGSGWMRVGVEQEEGVGELRGGVYQLDTRTDWHRRDD